MKPREVNVVLSHPKTGGNSLYYAAARARERVGRTVHTHYMSPPSAGFSATALADRLPGQFADASAQDMERLHWHSEFNAAVAEFARHWVQQQVPLPLTGLKPESHYDKARRADLPRTNVIIGVREPIACCLSGYFQVMSDTSLRAVPTEKIVADLRNIFKRTFPINQAMWWANQVHRFFGVDLLDLPFDRERGWQIHHFDRVSFLIVKQERFDRVPQAMSRLFDMPSTMISIGQENAAADKGELSELYAAARRGVRFGEGDFEQLYGNRWFRRFYTDEEEREFRNVWAG